MDDVVDWLKRLGGTLWGALLAVFGMGWLWERHKRLDAEAALEVAELQVGIATIEAKRDTLLHHVGRRDGAIKELDREIETHRLALLSHHEDPAGLTRDEIRARLAKLGY